MASDLVPETTDLRNDADVVDFVVRLHKLFQESVARDGEVLARPHCMVFVMRNPETKEPLDVPGIVALLPLASLYASVEKPPLTVFRDQIRKIALDLDAVGVVSIAPHDVHGNRTASELVLALEHKTLGVRYWTAALEWPPECGARRVLGPLRSATEHGCGAGVWFERMLPASYQS